MCIFFFVLFICSVDLLSLMILGAFLEFLESYDRWSSLSIRDKRRWLDLLKLGLKLFFLDPNLFLSLPALISTFGLRDILFDLHY